MAQQPTFTDAAQLLATSLLADQVGSVKGIPNSLASGALNTTILVDPAKIQAYRETLASQMNAQSAGVTFTDLSERIRDVIINTAAQGAGTVELHVIDPYLMLFESGFIQADATGYLYPPIDINFPSDTDCIWRLCQVRFTNELSDANLVLTFEDRIVSLLRQRGPANGGVRQGQPNQTLAGFVKELVDDTNYAYRPTPPIRFLAMVDPQDPNYTVPITQTPKSAVIGKLRTNPNRNQQGLTAVQQAVVDGVNNLIARVFPDPTASTSMRDAEQRYAWYAAQANNVDPIAGSYAPSAGVPGLGAGR